MPDGTLSNSSYAFVNTGIHVWNNETINEAPMGTANMYGQNYIYCLDNNEDARCAGGDSEEDHYFYFTDIVSSFFLFYSFSFLSSGLPPLFRFHTSLSSLSPSSQSILRSFLISFDALLLSFLNIVQGPEWDRTR